MKKHEIRIIRQPVLKDLSILAFICSTLLKHGPAVQMNTQLRQIINLLIRCIAG